MKQLLLKKLHRILSHISYIQANFTLFNKIRQMKTLSVHTPLISIGLSSVECCGTPIPVLAFSET